MKDIRIEPTLDGSNTLYIPSLDEHYHSVNGAVQESTHVYINAGLAQCEKDNINILEIGFGTGLNAFLTLLYTQQYCKKINYTTIELYPLDNDTISRLNYTSENESSEKLLFEKLHTSTWNIEEEITPFFSLSKFKYDLTYPDFSFEKMFDVIYFDAFAPDKQPEMWTQDTFNFLYSYTAQGGILTTYCAKGSVRRILQSSAYRVERLPGPPGKREILRAKK